MNDLTIKKTKKNFPSKPGCYIFKDKEGKVIYVGKAKNIKKRVLSYFRRDIKDYKTKNLMSDAFLIDFIITTNEVEALLLEARLIKEKKPYYNMKFKGGVPYAYIRITDEPFPRLESARETKRKDRLFGPFVSAQNRKALIHLANRLFKLRTSKIKPKKIEDCYLIRISTAPWLRKVTKEEYDYNIEKAALLLKGKDKELIEKLRQEMDLYSKKEEYELAKNRRDQIIALEDLKEKQKMHLKTKYDQDVINYVLKPKQAIVQIFNIYKGIVSGRKEFRFRRIELEGGNNVLASFIKQYYYSQDIPQEIVIPEPLPESALIEKYLSLRADREVRISVPQKGDKRKLLDLLKENILANMKATDGSLVELQNLLHLMSLPRIIECFDISNLGPHFLAGSMVRFKDGRPDKSNYRRFKIKSVQGQSDFDSMREVIFRRYYRLKMENEKFPDLIIVDGGKPQLTAAMLALRELGAKVPIISLAKQEEEIFIKGLDKPLKLPKSNAVLKLLQRVRNEAHRFAINYHRLLRSKKDY